MIASQRAFIEPRIKQLLGKLSASREKRKVAKSLAKRFPEQHGMLEGGWRLSWERHLSSTGSAIPAILSSQKYTGYLVLSQKYTGYVRFLKNQHFLTGNPLGSTQPYQDFHPSIIEAFPNLKLIVPVIPT